MHQRHKVSLLSMGILFSLIGMCINKSSQRKLIVGDFDSLIYNFGD